MDALYYEEIAGLLRGLTIRLSDRLPDNDLTLTTEFLDANELGLALEQIADALSEHEQPVTTDEHTDMLALADRMQMNNRVSKSLAALELIQYGSYPKWCTYKNPTCPLLQVSYPSPRRWSHIRIDLGTPFGFGNFPEAELSVAPGIKCPFDSFESSGFIVPLGAIGDTPTVEQFLNGPIR